MADVQSIHARNQRTALIAVSVVLAMVGLSYAAVPLYDTFCKITGFGGTTQVASVDDPGHQVLDRMVKVRFSASTHRDMPWDFKPVDPTVSVQLGKDNLIYYEAYNPTDRAIAGSATFNVTPFKAGSYFSKIECFCFQEQVLQPGERVNMPVLFYVDSRMDDDPGMDNVTEITLNYTFFTLEEETAALQGR
ncbi:MAG: cytochrome c oxidase assembly protein [Sphingomonadales bacterium]